MNRHEIGVKPPPPPMSLPPQPRRTVKASEIWELAVSAKEVNLAHGTTREHQAVIAFKSEGYSLESNYDGHRHEAEIYLVRGSEQRLIWTSYQNGWVVDGPWEEEIFAVIDRFRVLVEQAHLDKRKKLSDKMLEFYERSRSND